MKKSKFFTSLLLSAGLVTTALIANPVSANKLGAEVLTKTGTIDFSVVQHDKTNDVFHWNSIEGIDMFMETGTNNHKLNTTYMKAPRNYIGYCFGLEAADGYTFNKVTFTLSEAKYEGVQLFGTTYTMEVKTGNTEGKKGKQAVADSPEIFTRTKSKSTLTFAAATGQSSLYITQTSSDPQFRPIKAVIEYTLDTSAVVSCTGIEIAQNPTKLSYIAGETLDLTGLKVNALYSNGTSKDVTADITIEPSTNAMLSPTNKKITISYLTFSKDIPITVNLPQIATTDMYLTGETLGMSGSYSSDPVNFGNMLFMRNKVCAHDGNKGIQLKKTDGLLYNDLPMPAELDKVTIVFSEKYNSKKEPYNYSDLKVYASDKKNNTEAVNEVKPVVNGWVSTYDFSTKSSVKYLTLKAGSKSTYYMDMIVIEMKDAVMDKAESLATTLNNKLDSYCGIKAIDDTVWYNLEDLISAVEPEVKKAFTDAVYNKLKHEGKEAIQVTELQHFVERHDYIVTTHGLNDLLDRGVTPAAAGGIVASMNDSTIIIVSVSVLTVALLGAAVLIMKRRKVSE